MEEVSVRVRLLAETLGGIRGYTQQETPMDLSPALDFEKLLKDEKRAQKGREIANAIGHILMASIVRHIPADAETIDLTLTIKSPTK